MCDVAQTERQITRASASRWAQSQRGAEAAHFATNRPAAAAAAAAVAAAVEDSSVAAAGARWPSRPRIRAWLLTDAADAAAAVADAADAAAAANGSAAVAAAASVAAAMCAAAAAGVWPPPTAWNSRGKRAAGGGRWKRRMQQTRQRKRTRGTRTVKRRSRADGDEKAGARAGH